MDLIFILLIFACLLIYRNGPENLRVIGLVAGMIITMIYLVKLVRARFDRPAANSRLPQPPVYQNPSDGEPQTADEPVDIADKSS